MKRCTKCKTKKNIDGFHRGATVQWCKACISASRKAKRLALRLNEGSLPVIECKPVISPEDRLKLSKAKEEANIIAMIEVAKLKRLALEKSGYKVCTQCKVDMPLSEYHSKTRRRKDKSSYKSYTHLCRTCRNNYAARYRKSPIGKATVKKYRATPERKASNNMSSRLYKANAQKAKPKWLTKEQRKDIVDVYVHMRDCKVTTGEDYHVDHIVPLKGINVCGLHVAWNLQVLPADVNIRKSNGYEIE